jgi:Hypervirulence associated proteins TUDOR domain
MSISAGTTITWETGSSTSTGTVVAVHPRPVVRRFRGARVARIGTPEDPAYEIELADGTRTLRLHSEVRPPD